MSKLKVILLDDEMLIRKLIRMKMNAEELGLEIVGEFSNARSALQEIEELQPDIILSDICMPEMDGLSFGEECTRILPGVKIIVITGYNDFEYARRSLQVGVFDYLMKPVQSAELNKTLEKAIAQIELEREQQREQRELKDAVEKGLPVLRRSYINQLLLSDFPVYDMENSLIQYGIKINRDADSRLCIGLIAIQESFLTPDVVNEIHTEIENFFRGDDYVNIILDVWGRIVIISEESEGCFRECFELLLQDINKKFNYHINTGLSNEFPGWKEVRPAYLSALDDMQRNHENRETSRLSAHRNLTCAQGKDMKWSLPITFMKQNQQEEAATEVENMMLSQFSDEEALPKVKDCVMADIESLCREAELTDNMEQYCDMVASCRLQSDIRRCIRFQVMEMTLLIGKEATTEKGRLMLEIVAYIKNNLHQPTLGMGDLSEVFCCSSSHLSRLFKQYMGRTYSDFLSELRLWKMLSLMANDSEMLDRDIGEKIGILDAHYLSIWFRKMTGCSVTEYRKIDI